MDEKEYIEREPLKRDLIDRGFYPAIVKAAVEAAPAADVVEIDKFASKIAGHSYYRGDKILARLYCLKEGQEIEKSIEPADVVEVVHGEWTTQHFADGDVGYRCSACDLTSDWGTPFCPNCGAKMDGRGGE